MVPVQSHDNQVTRLVILALPTTYHYAPSNTSELLGIFFLTFARLLKLTTRQRQRSNEANQVNGASGFPPPGRDTPSITTSISCSTVANKNGLHGKPVPHARPHRLTSALVSLNHPPSPQAWYRGGLYTQLAQNLVRLGRLRATCSEMNYQFPPVFLCLAFPTQPRPTKWRLRHHDVVEGQSASAEGRTLEVGLISLIPS